MKWAVLVVRVLVGLGFTFFGAEYFLHLMGAPPAPPTEEAKTFAGVLAATDYFVVVKLLEFAGGLLVLSGRMAPLGLILLVPVTVNIALWDLLLVKLAAPPAGLILLALEIFLIWAYRPYFAALLTVNAKPA